MSPTDEARFLALLKEHRGILYKVAFGYCRDREDRGDLVQEMVMNVAISHFRDEARRDGRQWKFEARSDDHYGTSWIHVRDLVDRMLSLPHRSGEFTIADVSSGFFSYVDLHRFLVEKFQRERIADMPLFRSRFELKDELGLPQRDIFHEIDATPCAA